MAKFVSIRFKELLRKLHNAEHFDFFDIAIIKTLQTLVATIVTVNSMFDVLKTVFQREDVLYKLSQASVLTQDITALHIKRIALFNFFWNYVGIFKYLGDAVKALTAEKLLFLRNTYKELSTQSYSDASGMMTNFLQDCAKSEWAPLIQALGLTFLITQMTADNDAFREMYRDRSIDKEHIAALGKLAEARIDVDGAFDAMIDAINVTWKANEIGAKDPALRASLLEVKEAVVAAIHQAELNLARRGRHKTKDDENAGEGGQTPPGGTTPPPPSGQQQNPDSTLPAAPDTPNQNPSGGPHPLDPNEHPSMGEMH